MPHALCHIVDVDPSNHHDVEVVARLHLQLLDWGPMAQLGGCFLERFCYTTLIQDGLMKAAYFEVDGQPAGFIAFTDHSITFHRAAIKNHYGYVAYLVLISILRDPRVMLRLWRAMRLMFSRRSEKILGEDPLAEIVAIGVLPEYRNPVFMRRTGLRISEELVDHAASYFRSVGLKKIRLVIDADNHAALMFYRSLGAQVELYEQAGNPAVHVWLDLVR